MTGLICIVLIIDPGEGLVFDGRECVFDRVG